MAPGVGKWTSRLKEIASVQNGSWTNVVPKSAILPVIALFASLADLIGAAIGVPISVLGAFGEGLSMVVMALTGGSGRILDAGATESAQSLTSGVWAQFGPFTFVIAIVVVTAGAYVFARARSEEETGDFFWFLPDLPGPLGAEEEGGD